VDETYIVLEKVGKFSLTLKYSEKMGESERGKMHH